MPGKSKKKPMRLCAKAYFNGFTLSQCGKPRTNPYTCKELQKWWFSGYDDCKKDPIL